MSEHPPMVEIQPAARSSHSPINIGEWYTYIHHSCPELAQLYDLRHICWLHAVLHLSAITINTRLWFKHTGVALIVIFRMLVTYVCFESLADAAGAVIACRRCAKSISNRSVVANALVTRTWYNMGAWSLFWYSSSFFARYATRKPHKHDNLFTKIYNTSRLASGNIYHIRRTRPLGYPRYRTCFVVRTCDCNPCSGLWLSLVLKAY